MSRLCPQAYQVFPPRGDAGIQVARVPLALSPGTRLARLVLWLALFTEPQETRRVVVQDVALLRFG